MPARNDLVAVGAAMRGLVVAPHVYLEASGEVFRVSYQGINGNWTDLRAEAT